MNFDGSYPYYERQYDYTRLHGQLVRVFDLMYDGQWRTVPEVAQFVNAPQNSLQARLRDLRKEKFGEWRVDIRPRGDRLNGCWEYKLVLTQQEKVGVMRARLEAARAAASSEE